jgi:PAS domain S-box-containing protein
MNTTNFTATKQQLEIILEHVADGITMQDTNHQLVYLNPAAAKILGFSLPEAALAAGQEAIMSNFEIFDERKRPLALSYLPNRQALMGEAAPSRIIGYRSSADQPLRWSSVRSSPIYDRNKQIEFVVTVFQDITAIKNAELRLKDANRRITKLLENILKTEERV